MRAAIALMLCAAALAAAEPPAEVVRAEAERIAVIARVRGAVIALYGTTRVGNTGSGVIIREDGLALTNFHVVAPYGPTGHAALTDGALVPWHIVGLDPGGDIALVKLEGRERFPVAPLGDSDRVRVGDTCLAMGNPFNLNEDFRPTVTRGVVSGVGRYQGGPNRLLVYGNCIQIDTSINPGNSGGPLFNAHGEVIGINGRVSFEERPRVNVGVGYAVSINQVKNFLGDLLAARCTRHGTLEATFSDQGGRVLCDALAPGAPIAAAGLQQGDALVAFNGTRVRSANHFLNLVSTLPADWPVDIVWERLGERQRARVRLSPLPYHAARNVRSGLRKGDRKAIVVKPGTVMDEKANAAMARDLLRRCDDDAARDALGRENATVAIERGDHIGGRRVVRVRVKDAERTVYLWLSLFDDGKAWKVEIVRQSETPELQHVSSGAPVAAQAAPDGPFAEAVARAQRRCVKVYGVGRGRAHGYATGVIVSPDGDILAAHGLYLAAMNLRVVLADGAVVRARVVRRSEPLQAALLKIDRRTPEHFTLPTEPQGRPGDWMLALTNAYKIASGAEPLSVGLGIFSLRAELDARHRMQDVPYEGEVIVVDAITSNPGAPGGALVDADGRLVGMIGKIIESEDTNTRLNYAVPAERLKALVDGMEKPAAIREAKRAALGLRIFRLGGKRAPAYIDRVPAGSPAARAGLKKDDLIVAVGDDVVRNVRAYDRIAEGLRPGEEVVVIVKRGADILTIKLTPEAAE